MDQPIIFDEPRPVKLTVSDFAVLHRAGALDDHRRAELIDGGITAMSPLGTRHAIVTTRLLLRLCDRLAGLCSDLTAISAPTVAIPPHDAPEPDITIARLSEADDEYVDHRSVALAIEVSVSTVRYDLAFKRDLYARGEIPEYWVIDVERRRVHQFWAPIDGRYGESRIVPLAGELRSATLPELAIDGGGIL